MRSLKVNIIKTIVLFTFMSFAHNSFAQRYACGYDGYWGKWSEFGSGISFRGYYNSFVIYYSTDHPSEYFFKFTINNYYKPDKKEKKYHLKNNIWYSYKGTVEYYVNEKYPTIKDVFKKFGCPSKYFGERYSSRPPVKIKRTAQAEIRISPYKKNPNTYNFLFDDVGFGVTLDGIWD